MYTHTQKIASPKIEEELLEKARAYESSPQNS